MPSAATAAAEPASAAESNIFISEPSKKSRQ